mgnify:CR=1 FL=1
MSVISSDDIEESIQIEQRRVERNQKIESIAIPLATLVMLLLIWQFGVRIFDVPSYIAPAPSDVATTFVAKFPILLENFWPTLYESVLGFFAGNLAAIFIWM